MNIIIADGKFFPAGAGMSKGEVLDMIAERRTDEERALSGRFATDSHWTLLNEPAAHKLTDKGMQLFVHSWYELLESAMDEESDVTSIAEQQEQLLFNLAKEIQS